jgi:hypothetical protein
LQVCSVQLGTLQDACATAASRGISACSLKAFGPGDEIV